MAGLSYRLPRPGHRNYHSYHYANVSIDSHLYTASNAPACDCMSKAGLEGWIEAQFGSWIGEDMKSCQLGERFVKNSAQLFNTMQPSGREITHFLFSFTTQELMVFVGMADSSQRRFMTSCRSTGARRLRDAKPHSRTRLWV